jgi:hypothetical protein
VGQYAKEGGGFPPTPMQAAGMMGVTKAPGYITKTWEQQREEEARRTRLLSPLEKKRRGYK